MTEAETRACEKWMDRYVPNGPAMLSLSRGGYREALREAWQAGNRYGRASALLEGKPMGPGVLGFGPMPPP